MNRRCIAPNRHRQSDHIIPTGIRSDSRDTRVAEVAQWDKKPLKLLVLGAGSA